MTQKEVLLRVEGLDKSFGGLAAIKDVGFQIGKGELCCIIGPNGSGKTTLFNLLTGHLSADRGRVIFKGEDFIKHKLAPYDICRKGIGRSFQRVNIFPRMSPLENVQLALLCSRGESLNFFSPMRNMVKDESLRILTEVGLSEQATSLAGELAHGDQKRLEVAMAIANQPDLLLLDEPTAGMSPEETANTMELIVNLFQGKEMSIIVIEHDMEVVFGIAKRIIVLHQGQIIADGEPEEIKRNALVQKVYFGEKS
jgi:branched-chain amino acid transport system ATP-binding protein